MALIFALRSLTLGASLGALFFALFALNFSGDRQFESLLVLFSLFYLLVGLVLFLIRSSGHASRLMLLAPSLAALGPGWKWQLAAFWIGSMFFWESFRSQAQLFQGDGPFRAAQALWVVGGLSWLLLPPRLTLWATAGLLVALTGLFCHGCWRWQLAIGNALQQFE